MANWIVRWAEVDGADVLEIGPGRGALTWLLAERVRQLWLVEIDPRLAEELEARAEGMPHVMVIRGDALEVDLHAIGPCPVHVVSNLPYESGTAIVSRLLETSGFAAQLVVMLQEEVCARLVAPVGGKDYGALSVHTQLLADVTLGKRVPPSCFRPVPRVHSRVIKLRPLAHPRYEVGDRSLFARLVAAAFGQRRKMVRNTIGPFLDEVAGAGKGVALLEQAGVAPHERPERLSVEAFARLARLAHQSGVRAGVATSERDA